MDLARSAERFSSALVQSQQRYARELDALSPRLAASTSGLAAKRHALELAASRLSAAGPAMLSEPAARLAQGAAKLDALSPLGVLARGYSIAYSQDRVATSTSAFAPGSRLRVRLADGDVYGTVDRVEPSGTVG